MAPRSRGPRFEDLTETTGIPLSREGADMMYTRYRVAAELARGKRVLELGCGAGQGFGLTASGAVSVVGGDFSSVLLRAARRHYGDRVPLARLSADHLPFRSAAFDVVLFFEASYYVGDMNRGFDEIVRVLAPGGAALIVNANPERPDFVRSPHSVHYHSADEFRAALGARGLQEQVEGAFPIHPAAGDSSAFLAAPLRLARRTLDLLGLVPRTLRGRARLKRLVLGKLVTVPPELGPGFGQVHPRDRVPLGPARRHKIIYVLAHKSGTR
jgi:SAM-dependent methyltransferase